MTFEELMENLEVMDSVINTHGRLSLEAEDRLDEALGFVTAYMEANEEEVAEMLGDYDE